MNTEMQTVIDALGDPRDIDAVLDQNVSRREALFRSGNLGAALAVGAVPFAMGAMAKRAFAQGTALPTAVVTVLNFALTLEMLESDFYNKGVASGVIPSSDMAVFQQVQKHESAHVAFLKSVLGTSAIGQLNFDFTLGGTIDPFHSYPTFLILAQGFEDTGVRAYKGQAVNLKPYDAYLTAALRIHSVEARHASEIRRLRGQKGWITRDDPSAPAAIKSTYAGEENTIQLGIDVSVYLGVDAATEAFDEPLTSAQVLAIAGPFVAK
ncbi:MAG: ferritin-like domain-containing protein [Gemmatimonadaceae bacterium]